MLGAFTGVVVCVSLLVACGDDDDDVSTEQAFCTAGDDLRAGVEGLVDLDLVAEGTNGLEERLIAINDDLDAMKEAAAEVAAEEIETLEAAVHELDSALEAIGNEISIDNAGSAINAVAAVGTAAQDVYTTLDAACS